MMIPDPRPTDDASTQSPRFEHTVTIGILCRCLHHGVVMESKGNLSLREAGAVNTSLAYECPRCHRRVAVVDAWPIPSAATLAEIDQVE